MALSFAPERIEQWPLERLKPYARNAKTHGPDQVAKIAGSMAQFGWTVPVLVANDGKLIAGHGRILAAEQLGLTEAPVIVLAHLTEAQRRAENGAAGDRWANLGQAAGFFLAMLSAPIPTSGAVADDPAVAVRASRDKVTCLWLRGLPRLTPTHMVEGREARVHREPPGLERWRNRSRTFAGIAAAMAEQWGGA